MSSRVARIVVGNGIIEAAGGSTIRLRYVDPNDGSDVFTAQAMMVTPFDAAILRFTDEDGTDVVEYAIGDPGGVFITLQDSQRNKIASVPETVITSIFDSVTGNVVGVELSELVERVLLLLEARENLRNRWRASIHSFAWSWSKRRAIYISMPATCH
jgi:hypothetical protein